MQTHKTEVKYYVAAIRATLGKCKCKTPTQGPLELTTRTWLKEQGHVHDDPGIVEKGVYKLRMMVANVRTHHKNEGPFRDSTFKHSKRFGI